jgi:hypothetical protein
MAAKTPEFFTTEQLTRLLGLEPKDKWRVIKFAQGDEYDIRPSVSEASGSGSRRLYDVQNLCEFMLALRLLETGLRSRVIGRVIRELREKVRLSQKLEIPNDKLLVLYLVIVRVAEIGKPLDERRKQFVNVKESMEGADRVIKKVLENPNADFDVIVVPMGVMLFELRERLKKFRAAKREASDGAL